MIPNQYMSNRRDGEAKYSNYAVATLIAIHSVYPERIKN